MPEHPDREAIAARAEAATSGPWVDGEMPDWDSESVVSATATERWTDTDGAVYETPCQILDPPNPAPSPADREFIMHARTDVPALLDALGAAEAENERLRRALVDALDPEEEVTSEAALRRERDEAAELLRQNVKLLRTTYACKSDFAYEAQMVVLADEAFLAALTPTGDES